MNQFKQLYDILLPLNANKVKVLIAFLTILLVMHVFLFLNLFIK